MFALVHQVSYWHQLRQLTLLMLASLWFSSAFAEFPTGAQPPRQQKKESGAISWTAGADSSAGACAITSFASLGGRDSIFPWTRDPVIDTAYQNEGMYLMQLFGVAPAGGFMDDAGGPNAFATTERLFTNSIDGTVIFGIGLLQQEMARDRGIGFSVPGIMAHEFAHILQFKDVAMQELSTPIKELHADFLAGWYLAKRAQVAPTDVRSAMSAFFELGDYDFNSDNHHGTPQQRLDALMTGMEYRHMRIGEAYREGIDYLERQFK